MAVIRTKNKFGKRFMRLRELCGYAVDLDLCAHPPAAGLMEFIEAQGLLTPMRRIQMPPEILRRFAKDKYPSWPVLEPLEPDGERYEAAASLINAINFDTWALASVFGESIHVLDALASEHAPFVQTNFSPDFFSSWNDYRVHLYDTDQGPIYSSNERDTPAFYHYWQIFWLAAVLRSGLHVYYPLDDRKLEQQIWRGELSTQEIRARTHQSINLEAYRELLELRKYQKHFEATGYYQAYSHNAFQIYAQHHDAHGRIRNQHRQQYLRRNREIAHDTLNNNCLGESDIIEFIGQQCVWWDNARRIGPAAVAEEYKRNINASIGFLRAATDIDFRCIVESVGHRTGHFKPTLEVIFPDWTEEQRDLTIRSLKRWADDELAALPAPFPFTEIELNKYCDWLEEKGLFQYYWHFRRLHDLERRDDPVHRAASTSEVVGFATLCEMIANEVVISRGLNPRGRTLFPKLREVFGAHGPVDLNPSFDRFKRLANTRTQSLARRLAQIARITQLGPYSPVLRAILS